MRLRRFGYCGKQFWILACDLNSSNSSKAVRELEKRKRASTRIIYETGVFDALDDEINDEYVKNYTKYRIIINDVYTGW